MANMQSMAGGWRINGESCGFSSSFSVQKPRGEHAIV
jgi:hypothetical protein